MLSDLLLGPVMVLQGDKLILAFQKNSGVESSLSYIGTRIWLSCLLGMLCHWFSCLSIQKSSQPKMDTVVWDTILVQRVKLKISWGFMLWEEELGSQRWVFPPFEPFPTTKLICVWISVSLFRMTVNVHLWRNCSI